MINAFELDRIFKDCLFREGEDTSNYVLAEGVVNKFGFHPGRLESHRDEVKAILMELPINFRKSVGGGWSFLNMVVTNDGEQWGEQINAEQLMALGIGLKLVTVQLPRELWSALPGGMPYLVVEDA